MIIREADSTDARGIAKVHVDSWRTTYRNVVPDSFLERISYDQRTELWINNISKETSESAHIFVAENEEKEIVGFSSIGKRDTNRVEDSGDLTAIYLLESYQGKGIGKQLLKTSFEKFRGLDINRVFVEVLEDNQSRYFYESNGAQFIRRETVKIADKELNLLIYEWNNLRAVFDK
ncbi:GNAT family N-acetyltransferase [Halalkalibacillus sediminis]|uniref:GNAT family N-acetyltransferase n=1 Tax=Halalkalibacillus sediminis TaxID=2018042 RepID=A0A2I0QR50_9BACI|nr:GNAT family N-acetyltransferase [Halalkalibacillus sediminis]PKR76799.1 GNAT family N-acetyltransferase [Halalkalibacillus sediminis]